MKYKVEASCRVPCIYNCGKSRLLYTIFDTGAVSTTICANNLKDIDTKPTGRTRNFRSAAGTTACLKEIEILQFTVGNLDMGSCYAWIGPTVPNLLGMDVLSRLDWGYSSDTRTIDIVRPDIVVVQTEAARYVRQFCEDHNTPFGALIDTFPDNWEKLTRAEIENLALFAYNNIVQRI